MFSIPTVPTWEIKHYTVHAEFNAGSLYALFLYIRVLIREPVSINTNFPRRLENRFSIPITPLIGNLEASHLQHTQTIAALPPFYIHNVKTTPRPVAKIHFPMCWVFFLFFFFLLIASRCLDSFCSALCHLVLKRCFLW